MGKNCQRFLQPHLTFVFLSFLFFFFFFPFWKSQQGSQRRRSLAAWGLGEDFDNVTEAECAGATSRELLAALGENAEEYADTPKEEVSDIDDGDLLAALQVSLSVSKSSIRAWVCFILTNLICCLLACLLALWCRTRR
jgi:hypothetical protein